MEGELWTQLYRMLVDEAKLRIQQKRVWYSDRHILTVFLWAVLHDRPTGWACRRESWPPEWRWMSVPSEATMSRRMRTLSVTLLLWGLVCRLASVQNDGRSDDDMPCLCRRIDSKPLPVGGFSKDRDARKGYAAADTWCRGYKMFGVWGRRVVPDALRLGPMNFPDPTAGQQLIADLCTDPAQTGGYLLADATHDSNGLHEAAGSAGFQIVAPRRKPGSGLGHRVGGHSPWRLRSIEMLEGPSPFGRSLYAGRGAIERDYGNLCSFGGGLQPLPAWVRRPHRVARWVVAKIVINGVRICVNKQLAA